MSCRQRIELARCGQADTDGVDDEGAVEILENNAAAVSGDANSFDEFHQVVADQHYIRALAGDIGSGNHGDSNSGFAQRGSFIDTVTERRHRSSFPHLFRDETGLLLWKKLGMNIADAELANYWLRSLRGIVSKTTSNLEFRRNNTAEAEPGRNRSATTIDPM